MSPQLYLLLLLQHTSAHLSSKIMKERLISEALLSGADHTLILILPPGGATRPLLGTLFQFQRVLHRSTQQRRDFIQATIVHRQPLLSIQFPSVPEIQMDSVPGSLMALGYTLCWCPLEPCTPAVLMGQVIGSTQSSKSSCNSPLPGQGQGPSSPGWSIYHLILANVRRKIQEDR